MAQVSNGMKKGTRIFFGGPQEAHFALEGVQVPRDSGAKGPWVEELTREALSRAPKRLWGAVAF